MGIELVLLTGSVCLTLALLEAWLLVLASSAPQGLVAKRIPGLQDLLKSHLDYLLMALFLFVFYF